MKKLLPVILIMTLLSTKTFSQAGKNELGVAFDVGLPTTSYYQTGFGGLVKYLLGVGLSSQVTFTTGYSHFGTRQSGSLYIIPLAIGIRSNILLNKAVKDGNILYIEPQIGYARFGNESGSGGSSGGFLAGIVVGVVIHQFDLGVRYEGIFDTGSLSIIGIHAGYNFRLGHK